MLNVIDLYFTQSGNAIYLQNPYLHSTPSGLTHFSAYTPGFTSMPLS